VAGDFIIRREAEGEHLVEDFVREDGDLVIMWGSLVLPSVLLSSAEAAPRISEIMDADALLWMYRLGSLLERNYFEGVVTIAHVPQS